mmetsp:Transcript_3365/g.5541  ORF Transcript_3365/g.5541 Transcript_3365/m.5541 type:complete len:101 (-) Transcript_3365:785-1087(-)
MIKPPLPRLTPCCKVDGTHCTLSLRNNFWLFTAAMESSELPEALMESVELDADEDPIIEREWKDLICSPDASSLGGDEDEMEWDDDISPPRPYILFTGGL